MKATGIVRRIDDLGRVVIPKEIRRTMRIHEGDPLEIFTERDGEVIFKKYSPISQLTSFASDYAESINKTTGLYAVICDRDTVIATSGIPKKELTDKKISSELETLMNKRMTFSFNGESAKLYPVSESKYYIVCCCPIITSGDISGCVCIVAEDREHAPACTDMELKLSMSASHFLAKQLDI